jgi:hypothetical protein
VGYAARRDTHTHDVIREGDTSSTSQFSTRKDDVGNPPLAPLFLFIGGCFVPHLRISPLSRISPG